MVIHSGLRVDAGRDQERDQVGEVAGFQVFFESLGHERLARGGHLVDLRPEQDVFLAVLPAQGHGGGGLAGDQTVQDAAVDGGDRKVGDIFASSARLGSRMAIKRASGDLSFKAARSGPTSTPSLPRRWHEAHSFLKTVAPAALSPLIASAAR